MSESVLGVGGQILDCCSVVSCTCIYGEHVLYLQDFQKRTIALVLGIVLSVRSEDWH